MSMYLRKTRRKNKDGSVVEYFQLAHNHWDADAGRSRVEIIHNFGRVDQLEEDALRRLCRSIARVCGLEVKNRAQDLHEVGPVEVVRSTQLGVPHLARVLWERLGIGPAIREALAKSGAASEVEHALLAVVANRLDEPTSKLGVWERWLEHVHLPEAQGLSKDRFYEGMDVVFEHQASLEEAVFFETANLLNLEVDVIFYDTTTAEFALDEADDDDGGMRRLGYSKEERWSPQVVIALAVTREGLPVRSWVFPGNTADVTTVQQVRADLRGWKLGRVLFVGDAGMNSESNRETLMRGGGRYVLACGTSSTNEVVQDVLGRPGRFKTIADNLDVKEVVVGDGELRRRYLVCRNPHQVERQRAHRAQVLEELEAELARHRDAKLDRAWVAKLRASGRYGRYVSVRGDRIVIDRKKIKQAARHDGKWVLITNDDTLSAEDAAQAYKAQLIIERSFRTMKSVQLEVRPMFHRLDRRIVAHVKVCVLALLMTRVAELATGVSWPRLRQELRSLQVIEVNVDQHGFLQRSEPSGACLEFLKKLDVQLPSKVLGTWPLEEASAAS